MANLVPAMQGIMMPVEERAEEHKFVTIVISNQPVGISVMHVEDVLKPRKITRVPLAPPDIAGTLNLRGRIVTAVDLRSRLGLPPFEHPEKCMSVVIEHDGYLYSLLIDSIGDVLSLPLDQFEKTPPNLDERWRSVAAGVYRLDGTLLMVLDINKVLSVKKPEQGDEQ